jgi:predicted nucleic acid-binding protein
MAYLIDSDVMVDFIRGNAKAADYLDNLGDDCLLSAITPLELIAGARNQREATDLDTLLSAYEQIPPTEEIAPRAYALMMTFARSYGHAVGMVSQSRTAREPL